MRQNDICLVKVPPNAEARRGSTKGRAAGFGVGFPSYFDASKSAGGELPQRADSQLARLRQARQRLGRRQAHNGLAGGGFKTSMRRICVARRPSEMG